VSNFSVRQMDDLFRIPQGDRCATNQVPYSTAAAVALAWTIRSGNVIAIPESGSPAHVKENAVALALRLTPQELQTLNAAHPARGLFLLTT